MRTNGPLENASGLSDDATKFSPRDALKWTENAPMDPYIKAKSPLRGSRKPGIRHGPGLRRIERRQREELAAVRRALKKAARREGKKEIADEM